MTNPLAAIAAEMREDAQHCREMDAHIAADKLDKYARSIEAQARGEWRPICEASGYRDWWVVWSAYYDRPVVVSCRGNDNTYWEGDWDFNVQATHYMPNPPTPLAEDLQ